MNRKLGPEIDRLSDLFGIEIEKPTPGQSVLSPSEILASPSGSAIVQLCGTRISFRNPQVRTAKIRQTYLEVGFTEDQVDTIGELGDRDFLIATDKGHQVVRLDPDQFELAIFGGASDEDRQLVDALRETHGSLWLDAYLRRRTDQPELAAFADGLLSLNGVPA